MKVALITKWTGAVPGRERMAIDFAREVDDFWGKRAADGACSEPEWFWSSSGPDMWMVTGEMDRLQEVMAMPEAQELIVKGDVLLVGYEYGLHQCGREGSLRAYESVLEELGIS